MSSDPEIYPMALFPQLAVSDVEASTAWYRALGFEVAYEMPVMTHVRYRKHADVMLVADRTRLGRKRPSAETAHGAGVTVYVNVLDESVDDVAERAAAYGATPDGPHATSWNTREVVVSDPDGYRFAFSERDRPNGTVEELADSWEQ